MCKVALRSLFLFYHRVPIFLDFIIRQLSMVQVDLAEAAKAIDVSTTEKRILHAILDVIGTINSLIGEILKVKGFFLECFTPPVQKMMADNAAQLVTAFGPSEWGMIPGSFTFFPDGLNELVQADGSLSFVNLVFLGTEAPLLDLEALRILQTMTAISFAANAMASLGKSFYILQTVSVDHSDATDGLVRDIRGLAQEICVQLGMMGEFLDRIRLGFERTQPE